MLERSIVDLKSENSDFGHRFRGGCMTQNQETAISVIVFGGDV